MKDEAMELPTDKMLVPTKRDFADVVRQKTAELNRALANAVNAGARTDVEVRLHHVLGRQPGSIVSVDIYDRI